MVASQAAIQFTLPFEQEPHSANTATAPALDLAERLTAIFATSTSGEDIHGSVLAEKIHAVPGMSEHTFDAALVQAATQTLLDAKVKGLATLTERFNVLSAAALNNIEMQGALGAALAELVRGNRAEPILDHKLGANIISWCNNSTFSTVCTIRRTLDPDRERSAGADHEQVVTAALTRIADIDRILGEIRTEKPMLSEMCDKFMLRGVHRSAVLLAPAITALLDSGLLPKTPEERGVLSMEAQIRHRLEDLADGLTRIATHYEISSESLLKIAR